MQRYNPKDIEPKWQAQWQADKIYEASNDSPKPKKYVMEYFPYPSGAAMHVGHVRNYAIGDAMARFDRMNGFNVLHPMGWDGFGLPAENYAIKTGTSPRHAIDVNTERFKKQLIQMGFSYDWSREIDSTQPSYYRWTQWFFLLLFDRGLAYQQESLQWWCPFDKTVLANEQVEAGRCWRCGNMVEKKSLKQWFFKITDYADRLSADLDNVNWSESIKSMQRNWIGRSQGAEIIFPIVDHEESLTIFTTRADTLFGVTYMVLAPENTLVQSITMPAQRAAVDSYIKATQAKTEIERQETGRTKTGVFTGAYAVHPLTQEKVPIWIADYVLNGYGTGAIMAVPAHDERDHAFAETFGLSIIPVVTPTTDRAVAIAIAHDPVQDKYCIIRWPKGHWRTGVEFPGGGLKPHESISEAALREFSEETGYTDASVTRIVPFVSSFYYHAHNHDDKRAIRHVVELTLNSDHHSGIVGVEDYEKDAYSVEWLSKDALLAARSKMDEGFRAITDAFFTDAVFHGEGTMINSGSYTGLSSADTREKIVADLTQSAQGKEVVNYKMRDWLISRQRYWGAPIPIIHCPKDGAVAVPKDQLPVILPTLKSFEPSGDGKSPLANVPSFVNTTCPKCGGPAERETDTMDGFACSSWYFLRFADPHNDTEPFARALADKWLPVDDYIGGAEHAVMHLLYARFWTKVMQDAGLIDFSEPFTTLRNHGLILAPDGAKMSKSKGNTIEPDSLIEQGYGADSIRVMELFIGPWNQAVNWSVEGLGGIYRFLNRVWALVQPLVGQQDTTGADNPALRRATHHTIKQVGEAMQNLSFNTAIAALMSYVNDLYKFQDSATGSVAWRPALETLLLLLAPFAPHISEELWNQLGHKNSIHMADWPIWDEQYLIEDTLTIAVQVNGKVRGEITVASDASEAQIIAAAHTSEKIEAYLADKTIHKTIYVPKKIISFVV
jgi:leucyl-tRNA synthetase